MKGKRQKIDGLIKALMTSYLVTGGMLLVLAFLLYKINISEQLVSTGIFAIYMTATLVGGLLIGKKIQEKRFIWGMLLGASYFILLLLISLGVYHSLDGKAIHYIAMLLLCIAGGMIGGMIS